ncbi:MAG: hypothetical protein PVF75_03875 [Granulosicoccaceae bacterium]|jgi:hypothetical protein
MTAERPPFTTAIPKQRYRWRGYELVVLGEIENNGPEKYRYILAVVAPGQQQPDMYFSVEQSRRADRDEGMWSLWRHDEDGKQLQARDDGFADIEMLLEVASKVIAGRYQLEGKPLPV